MLILIFYSLMTVITLIYDINHELKMAFPLYTGF